MIWNFLHIFGILSTFTGILLLVYNSYHAALSKDWKDICQNLLLMIIILLNISAVMMLLPFFADMRGAAKIMNQSALFLGPFLYVSMYSIINERLPFKYIYVLCAVPFIAVLCHACYLVAVYGFYLDIETTTGYYIRIFESVFNLFFFLLALYVFISGNFGRRKDIRRIYLRLIFVFTASMVVLISRALFYITWSSIGVYGNYVFIISVYVHSIIIAVAAFVTFFSRFSFSMFALKIGGNKIDDNLKNPAWTEIEKYMEENKPYLEPDLSLYDFSALISQPPHAVSRIINECFGKNFFEFLNTYRVDEAKRLFAGDRAGEKTIIEIMHDSGFNSKSVFNSSFKKYSGMTPKEFRKFLKERLR